MFPNGDLEEEVFMNTPPGFKESFGTKVCKLRKYLYGLKHFAQAWFKRFIRSIKNQGYSHGQTDHTIFIKHTGEGKIVILIIFVDGIIFIGSD